MIRLMTVIMSPTKSRCSFNMKEKNEQLKISLATFEEIEIFTDSLVTKQIACSRKTVHFDSQVRVHKHALILGDNPAVSDGVPLQLSWEAECTEVWKLRDGNQRRRRLPSKLSSYVRKVIASDQSSRNCLVQVREEIRAIQKSRRESAHPKISLYDIFFPSKNHLAKNHYGSKAQNSHMFSSWI